MVVDSILDRYTNEEMNKFEYFWIEGISNTSKLYRPQI